MGWVDFCPSDTQGQLHQQTVWLVRILVPVKPVNVRQEWLKVNALNHKVTVKKTCNKKFCYNNCTYLTSSYYFLLLSLCQYSWAPCTNFLAYSFYMISVISQSIVIENQLI